MAFGIKLKRGGVKCGIAAHLAASERGAEIVVGWRGLALVRMRQCRRSRSEKLLWGQSMVCRTPEREPVRAWSLESN